MLIVLSIIIGFMVISFIFYSMLLDKKKEFQDQYSKTLEDLAEKKVKLELLEAYIKELKQENAKLKSQNTDLLGKVILIENKED